MRNPDRFDCMLLGVPTATVPRLNTRPIISDRQPVIASARGPRYVAHMTCPMCGGGPLGIEFHGELMSGAKVHMIAAHTAGLRRSVNGQPRCFGAGMRVELVDGAWKGAPR